MYNTDEHRLLVKAKAIAKRVFFSHLLHALLWLQEARPLMHTLVLKLPQPHSHTHLQKVPPRKALVECQEPRGFAIRVLDLHMHNTWGGDSVTMVHSWHLHQFLDTLPFASLSHAVLCAHTHHSSKLGMQVR
jgi:hypothetical protein